MIHKTFKKTEPYLYLIPALALLLMFTYYPFFKNVYLSLFVVDKYRVIKEFCGLENYLKVFNDEKFIKAIINTLIYVAATVPVSMAIGFGLALLARKKKRFSIVYEALFALPMAVSASVVAMIFQLAYNPSLGIINQMTGLNINWLTDSKTALLSLIIIQIWANIGYNFIFFLSALRDLSEEILEGATMDGAKGWRLFSKIIVPLIAPTIMFLLVSDIAHAMTTASFTLILTEGGPNGATETIVSYIYAKAIRGRNYNSAFAATTVGFFMSACMLALSQIIERKKVSYD